MVDVEVGSLGPFEQHPFAFVHRLVQPQRRVGRVLAQPVPVFGVGLDDLVGVEGQVIVQMLEDLVYEGNVVAYLGGKNLRIQAIADTNAGPRHLVLV